QVLAREFGATDVITERGEEGAARVRELTDGLGAHSVIEAVGTEESLMQAIGSTRGGGHIGFVGVAHDDVKLPMDQVFFSEVHLHGGPAPVRRYLPELIELIWDRRIDPGKVFDLTLPLEDAICPGIIETPMMGRFSGGTPEGRARVIAQEPVGRMGRPEEIDSAALWLCSDLGGFAVSHALVVDGGQTVGIS